MSTLVNLLGFLLILPTSECWNLSRTQSLSLFLFSIYTHSLGDVTQFHGFQFVSKNQFTPLRDVLPTWLSPSECLMGTSNLTRPKLNSSSPANFSISLPISVNWDAYHCFHRKAWSHLPSLSLNVNTISNPSPSPAVSPFKIDQASNHCYCLGSSHQLSPQIVKKSLLSGLSILAPI